MSIVTPTPSAEGAKPAQVKQKLTVHPHGRVLILPVFYTLIYAAPLIAIMNKVGNNTFGRTLFALVAIVGGAAWIYFAVMPAMSWYRTTYVFAPDRVLLNRGMFPRAEQSDIPLRGVNEVHVMQFGWDFVFRSGTLQLGNDKQDQDKRLENVPRVKWMKEYVIILVDDVHGRGADIGVLEEMMRSRFGRSHADPL